MPLPVGNPNITIDIVWLSIAFALSVWLLYDTRGALRRIFFYSRHQPSPRMVRFIWVDAALIALGTAYVLLSYIARVVWPD